MKQIGAASRGGPARLRFSGEPLYQCSGNDQRLAIHFPEALMKRTVLPTFFLLAASLGPQLLCAQESDVRAAVQSTFAAWNKGDAEAFHSSFMPAVNGFFLDNSPLVKGGGTVDDLRKGFASGLKPNVVPRDITIQVYGNTAVIAAYVDGTVTTPDKKQFTGPWRFTETRILDGGKWKTVQWHFSQLAPQS